MYPTELVLVANGVEVARHARSFERHQTIYDWQHYIALVTTKPERCATARPSGQCPRRCRRTCCVTLVAIE